MIDLKSNGIPNTILDAINQFAPYKDDGVSISLPPLTIENASDRVSITLNGENLDITCDREGLTRAKNLASNDCPALSGCPTQIRVCLNHILQSCIHSLENTPDLPQKVSIRPTIELPGDPFS
ncbi:hypothetical protein CSR02_01295 [Acetobacter pomorum]|uniref:Uncharacterized protein n=1 Tax=Acetobacter pomorum TaxID=65959 RepID=A0A2G4RFN8_9PROT|nr:hypothetical protein [Acetobacter pomorum]PHY95399.1 hypothetical protein CSR02_01295 [Acetobacter pomorum]